QLLVLQTRYTSESHCFANGTAKQLVADFTPFGSLDRYPTLAEYRTAKGQDLHSREGACGFLPAKVDVHALHAATLAYPGRPARQPDRGRSRLARLATRPLSLRPPDRSRLRHREHRAEADAPGDHLVVGLRDALKRERLDHGTDSGEGAELQRLLRVL